jgi:hypothetical protein
MLIEIPRFTNRERLLEIIWKLRSAGRMQKKISTAVIRGIAEKQMRLPKKVCPKFPSDVRN